VICTPTGYENLAQGLPWVWCLVRRALKGRQNRFAHGPENLLRPYLHSSVSARPHIIPTDERRSLKG
jgi:hypothetical protein